MDLVFEDNDDLSAVIGNRYSEAYRCRSRRPTAPAREPTAGDQLRHVKVHRTARFVAQAGSIPQRALTAMMTGVSSQN